MSMRIPTAVWPLLVIGLVTSITSLAIQNPVRDRERPPQPALAADLRKNSVHALDGQLERLWTAHQLVPAPAANELTVLRRLSLALFGTAPSLEEIRRFEADQGPDRLERWTAAMLDDPRFADYFAERLARAFVGVEAGQFILYRRDRFTHWLSEQLRTGRRYDDIVRELIASDGVWTDRAQVNFITAAYANDELDENALAGRTVRAFLGQRLDCAQCHDHPFSHWKQHDFEGLAACFGQTRLSLVGIHDDPGRTYSIEDRMTLEPRAVSPGVPFGPEWFPTEGLPRQRLAAWVTHPENRRFERAIANRVWALMFGRPFLTDRAVDDLPDPDDAADSVEARILDELGRDFRAHDCDLRRLVQVIAASRAFRLDSRHLELPDDAVDDAECRWAIFPLVRLRPEQVIGSMLQASSIRTVDQNSHLVTRTLRFFRERDFVEDFGDPGENELSDRTGTIPQALLRMNGELSKELTDANPLNSTSRIAGAAATPAECVDVCFLVCLSRRATPAEHAELDALIPKRPGQPRHVAVADLMWALFNAPEFSWNH
ncbi:MAG: DUF1549 domain-containing protein [Planctomyces sp.]|nr:DUF1549 domain-containing protein [Planctomyces sp.]